MRALLDDVPELTRQLQRTRAGHDRGFDVHDVPAHRGPGETGDDARDEPAGSKVIARAVVPRGTEHLLDELPGDHGHAVGADAGQRRGGGVQYPRRSRAAPPESGPFGGRGEDDASAAAASAAASLDGFMVRRLRRVHRRRATERREAPLQAPHARLSRVAPHDNLHGLAGNREPRLGAEQPVLVEDPRHHVRHGDVVLLLGGVPRDVDHLHAVAERAGYRPRVVRGGEERDPGQVERDAEVVVGERVVLLGVQNLEHRRRRVPARVRAHLIELVQE